MKNETTEYTSGELRKGERNGDKRIWIDGVWRRKEMDSDG